MQQHAVLAQIAGERVGVLAQAGAWPKLPPFATAVAALSTVHGGLGLRPLKRLAETGVLHVAALTQSLPRLLPRLEKPGSGALARAVAAEIRAVATSMLPWAIAARTARARLVLAVGKPLPEAGVASLKELLPSMKEPGKPVEVPAMDGLVTKVERALQHAASIALWQRDFAQLYAGAGQYEKFLLRSGSAPGATAHLLPLDLCPFAPSHLAGADRMRSDVYRMAMRYCMGLEPLAGTAAAIRAGNGCCPSCKQGMEGYDTWAVTNHLVSCSIGGGTQRTAMAITQAVQRCMADVGIPSERETPGLSATSAHRPGDAVSGPMTTPTSFDAGGEVRVVVDTTVSYLNPSNFDNAVYGEPDAEVTKAEAEKVATMRKEVAEGKRSALPQGYEFVPAAMDSRGRLGPKLAKLLEWLAEHGAAHSRAGHATNDEGGNAAKKRLLVRFRARMAVGLHRALMQAYLFRAQEVARQAEARTGLAVVTGLELRFQQ